MTDILEDELIGLKVVVVKSTDPTKEGITGKVVDETLKTLVIETKDGDKIVAKKESVFEFTYGGKSVYVDGKMIYGRSEDRLKKGRKLKRKWNITKKFFKSQK